MGDKKLKNIRLATKKYDDGYSYEYIEIDSYGVMFWKAVDYSGYLNSLAKNAGLDKPIEGHNMQNIDKVIRELVDSEFIAKDIYESIVEASFPCDIEFVEDFFQKLGRKLDITRLPGNVVLYPYGYCG